MSLASAFYNTIAKRNSVYVSTIFASAFAFTIGLDVGVNSFYDRWNRGKQWKDIRDRYVEKDEE